MRAVLILNPASGDSSMATTPHTTPETNEEQIIAGLTKYGIEVEVRHTTEDEPGEGLARQAADEHVEMVIAAGGDGTIHSVASGLIGRKSTLGIIPLGTMNNLARSLGIPTEIEEACKVIGTGVTHTVDVGTINGQTFLEVAGVGLEAALFPAAEEFKSSHPITMVRGVISGLITLFTFRPIKLKISFDEGDRRRYDAIQVTICNSPYYGAHFQAAPDALMDDGLLDVIIYRHFSKWEYIRHAISITQGRRKLQPKIAYRRAKAVHISADHPVEIQADGLPHGHTPADVGITQGALFVRVPEVEVKDAGIRGQSVMKREHVLHRK